jgi:predicted phage-related endonuclease
MSPPRFRRTGHIGMSAEAKAARKNSIGGSDAKIIMSGDQHAVMDLWLQKRGEIEGPDFDDVILIHLGNVTEELNFDLFEDRTGLWVTDEQIKVVSEDFPFMHATLDGFVRETEHGPPIGIMDAKFNLPFNDWSIEKALETHWAQLQHNMIVTGTNRAWLSVIKATGGFAHIECEADIFFQVEMVEAERAFWQCVQTGEPPNAVAAKAGAPKPEQIVVYDMTSSNSWATHAARVLETLEAVEIHDLSKAQIKELFPSDAAVATGHGVKMKRSKDGKALFEITGQKEARQAAKDLILGVQEKPKRSRAKKAAAPTPELANAA